MCLRSVAAPKSVQLQVTFITALGGTLGTQQGKQAKWVGHILYV